MKEFLVEIIKVIKKIIQLFLNTFRKATHHGLCNFIKITKKIWQGLQTKR